MPACGSMFRLSDMGIRNLKAPVKRSKLYFCMVTVVVDIKARRHIAQYSHAYRYSIEHNTASF